MSSHPQVHRARRISRLVRGIPAADGAGLQLSRVVGTPALPDVDPFLMLDEFYSSGHSDATSEAQPYRGFETITYMLTGALRYSDHLGNEAVVAPGDVQWMTAAKGLVHTEAFEAQDGPVHGFQVWLNLPAAEKMLAPVYRAIPAADIPAVIFKDAEVKVLAGQYHGLIGPVQSPTTRPFVADVTLSPEADISLPIPEGYQGFVYVFEGAAAVEQTLVNRGQAGLLDAGNLLNLVAGGEKTRILVVMGQPLNEPIVRHGPFVMTTQQDIKQAFIDYQNGEF